MVIRHRNYALTILAALLLYCAPAFAASQWELDNVAGNTDPTDLDTVIQENNDALDRILRNYRHGCAVVRDSASQITIKTPCEVMICNSGSTDCEMRGTSADITVTAADLDTGASFTASTIHYLYATSDTDVTNFVEKVSTSSTAPSGATQYRQIGYFYVDASSNILHASNTGGGDVANLATVSGTSDISTSSSSYADMTDMTIYFVSSARPVKLTFSAPLRNTANEVSYVTFDIDGTDYCAAGQTQNVSDPTAKEMVTKECVVSGLSSGARTMKVQWKNGGSGTVSQDGSSIANRHFIAEEI